MPDKRIIKHCIGCGAEFVAKRNDKQYCSIECRRRFTQPKYNDRRKAKRANKNAAKLSPKTEGLSIGEIACLARAEGMSYGRYVAKYSL